jgi:cytochrome b561
MKNSKEHWGSLARNLHWLMAALIIVQWVLGKVGHELARSPAKLETLSWHKSIGVTLLLLVLVRCLWRLVNPTPAPPANMPRWEVLAAKISHGALYFLMIAIPLSGWVMNSAKNIPMKLFWLVPWPDITQPSESLGEAAEEVHEVLAVGLLIVVLLHVAAALRHHFIRRDNVLRRMGYGKHARP